MELKEILADVKTDGDTDPFGLITVAEESPSESLPENEPEGEEPVEGDLNTQPDPVDPESDENSPFHKRWKAREENLKREMQEDFDRKLEEFRQSVQTEAPHSGEGNVEIPEWFQDAYGDNPNIWEKFNKYEQARKDEIKRELVQEQAAAIQAQQAESAHWEGWVESEIDRLASEGKEFDRNELIQTILKYKPTNEENNFDFDAGFEIYQALHPTKQVNPAKSQARKQLADTATASAGGEKPVKDYMTSNDLRGRSFSTLLD